jgi:iron complex outermembrane receptor protein
MYKYFLLGLCNIFFLSVHCKAQEIITSFSLTITDERNVPVSDASVELLKEKKLIKVALSDSKGIAEFQNFPEGNYTFSISHKSYRIKNTDVYSLNKKSIPLAFSLQPADKMLQEVSVTSRKAFIQNIQGKVILNVDAAVTNVGTTVLEVLEKSPGIMVDRNGGISLKGKTGVQVMIDDKLTYLSGADLNNLLSSMSSSQVDQIELITNPSAKYDASGNAGIINIKTKKTKTKGFNGSFTIAAGQGVYPKNNNSLVLNYRNGKFNTFLNYSMNLNKYLTDIYAYRKYFDDNGNIKAILDQPTYFSGTAFNNTLKAGIDYYISAKTTAGIVLGGTTVQREGGNRASATWLNSTGAVDSAVSTTSTSDNSFRNGSLNFNLRHTISSTQDLSFDIDWLKYAISSKQFFNNKLLAQNGYEESSQGSIPSDIQILSIKADHKLKTGKTGTLQSGWKWSHINSDNLAAYQYFDGNSWREDYGKTNHFFYKENIQAIYSSFETKIKKFSLQAGLRYEHTSYDANQLGNILQKDSAFSRTYGGFFPSGHVSYEADSANTFTFTAGRRIDRPAFQKLNPFFFIINKYTYQTGNPFFLPQYSWNLELAHQYKSILTTSVSYSLIKNYFSQLFLTDTSGILLYSEGNVGRTYNIGASAMLILSPTKWWSFTAQAIYNHKQLKGFNGNAYTTEINQLNFNLNNQFKIGNIYTGEISGFYTTKARNDLQELLYPTGQLSLGIARPVLKKKGTLKFSARDIFYTNAMEGLTQFEKATEYFILKRDTRVFNLAFTYRFGKAYKSLKRSGSSVNDEIQRVGAG